MSKKIRKLEVQISQLGEEIKICENQMQNHLYSNKLIESEITKMKAAGLKRTPKEFLQRAEQKQSKRKSGTSLSECKKALKHHQTQIKILESRIMQKQKEFASFKKKLAKLNPQQLQQKQLQQKQLQQKQLQPKPEVQPQPQPSTEQTKMVFCSLCGEQNKESTSLCISCGTELKY